MGDLLTASLATPEPLAFAASTGAVDIELLLAPRSVNNICIEWQPAT